MGSLKPEMGVESPPMMEMNPAWQLKPRIRFLSVAIGLLASTSAASHPYDDPLRFEPHTHEGGRVIFTNIPKRCFRDGVLICLELHPLLNNRPPPETADQPPRVERSE